MTFVLVHGSNSNAFGWAGVVRELGIAGHRCVPVDLPGHGFDAPLLSAYQAPQDLEALASAPSPLAEVSFAQTVQHVVDTVRRVAVDGPVTLVGHSRGGLAITSAGNIVSELIHRIVYITAWCPVDYAAPDYAAAPENADSLLADAAGVLVGSPEKLGVLRSNWRTADRGLLATLREAILADGTEAEFLAMLNTLQPDEILDLGGDADRADPETWGRIPRSYLRCTADRSMPLALQDRFIREADARTPDNPFDVHTLDASHCGVLVHPAEPAAILAGLE